MARPATIGNRRSRRMASTRQGLLAAGRKLFSDKGLYESRVEEITETADVGKGTLYRYFRNKEALILAVVEAGFEELRSRVQPTAARARDLDEVVEAVAESHVRFFADNQDLMRIFHQSRGMLKFNRPEWRPLSTSLERHVEFLAGELGRHLDPRRTDAARRRDVAHLIFGCVSGTLSVRVSIDPDLDLTSLIPDIVSALREMTRALTGSSNNRPAWDSKSRVGSRRKGVR